MSRVRVVSLCAGIAVVLGIIIGVVSWYSDGVGLNESTIAQFRDNQNKYDAFWKSVAEVAQVPGKYKEDFKDLILSETKAKYGPEGSDAQVQWFRDRDIRLDASVYLKVQAVIEAGRADFKRGQQDLLDKQRRASTHAKTAWGSFAGVFCNPFKEIGGDLRPAKDLDGDGKYTIFDYDIITSARTKAVFATGEDNEPLNVFE